MDFYDELLKYEDLFGVSILYNLEVFEKEIKNIIVKDNKLKDNEKSDGKENINIKEIIKEIQTSNKLKELLQTKYNLIQKKKYYIFAQNIKKKINRNFNNQKGILNNNIKSIEFTLNNFSKEIKEELKSIIKEKYLFYLINQKENLNDNKKYQKESIKNDSISDIDQNFDFTYLNYNNRKMNNNIQNFSNNNSINKKKYISIFNEFTQNLKHKRNITFKKNIQNEIEFKKHHTDNNNSKVTLDECINEEKKEIINKNQLKNIMNKENNINLKTEISSEEQKKKTMIKFKIGKYNTLNKKKKEKTKQIIRIKPIPEIKINKDKYQIKIKGKRILSSRMTIRNEDNLIKQKKN